MRRRTDSSGTERPTPTRLNNEQRRANATKAIEAKVQVLEAIADREMPLMEGLPTSMRQFRHWVNLSLGLVTIGSSGTTDPNESPHNGVLIGRAYDAMKAVAKLQSRRKLRVYVPVGKRADKLAQELAALKEDNRRLASEALEFKHKYDNERKARKHAEDDRAVARSDLQSLRLDYLKATKSIPRSVK